MSCPVLESISIDPKIVQLGFDRAETTSQRFSLFLTRTSRDKNILKEKPNLPNVPEYLTVKKNSVYSYETEIEKGLWQKEWYLEFEVKLPEEKEIPEISQPLSLTFEGDSFCSVDFTLILSKNYGVKFPPKVVFPDTRLFESRTRSFSIQSATNSPFEIKSVFCDHPCFSTALSDSADKLKQHWIDIIFTPTSPGKTHGVITLTTSHANSEEIMIEVEGMALSEGE